MPNIYDNITEKLVPALQQTLASSFRADFCVGYFNLRGWQHLDEYINSWSGGEGQCCRLLIGMQSLPQDEVRAGLRVNRDDDMDQQTAIRLKRRVAESLREQLTYGAPSNRDEQGLRRLSLQLREKKVVVKLFLRYHLHAKLYVLYRHDFNVPIVGYLGSSNLTNAGLQSQGELNVDVVEGDAAKKLAVWFDDRWEDHWCLNISAELADIIDASWAREVMLPPYYIYLKMAYHLSQEARAGLSEFRIPRDFGNRLFPFQKAAVQIAARHLNTRGGVLIGDVVGLGKTLMATALARIFQDDFSWETLIICPKNLEKMWNDYREMYHLIATIVPISQVDRQLPELHRFRLVLIDESHNLRNREGKRYRVIHDYIEKNESRCILLTATPYNKSYLDLSAQLRLFIPDDKDLGIRPERLFQDISEAEFTRRYQCGVRTLAAFEKSDYTDDWRDLMRLFMVRRTRTFIQQNYAPPDPQRNGRRYLTMEDGTRSYFPERIPKTIMYTVDDLDTTDPYARLYSSTVVTAINDLYLPRYGLGNYILAKPKVKPTEAEKRIIDGLSRSGKRLMGFCRTNLFKRLESGGPAFIQSIERHILRNYVYLYALEMGKDIPIGTQEAELIDPATVDLDYDTIQPTLTMDGGEDEENTQDELLSVNDVEQHYRDRAAAIYARYTTTYKSRFKWLRSTLFGGDLAKHIRADARSLLTVLRHCGTWNANNDHKLTALVDLLMVHHPTDKVLIFSQFADTIAYLLPQLRERGVTQLAGVTGESADPTNLAWRFSPRSNHKSVKKVDELRVLVATDVLSEGQNLQDCAIIINFDLPWAIIRLIQRAGRVDRIGQQAEQIVCYSFLPADGVERLIRLRQRVRQRLRQNAEVVGTDEIFFDDDGTDQSLADIYHEKANIYNAEIDSEVDLASQAFQIWKNAIDANPDLQQIITELPPVVYASRAHRPTPTEPEGVLLYMRTIEGNDALARVDTTGKIISQSLGGILKAAECALTTPAQPRNGQHHDLVVQAVQELSATSRFIGGQLGSHTSTRYRVYTRLAEHVQRQRHTLWESKDLEKALDIMYRFPLQSAAAESLSRQRHANASVQEVADLVVQLYQESRLCIVQSSSDEDREPQIICSLGLFAPNSSLNDTTP